MPLRFKQKASVMKNIKMTSSDRTQGSTLTASMIIKIQKCRNYSYIVSTKGIAVG